jgi:myo-inositol-1(or 4)-monophosphatase
MSQSLHPMLNIAIKAARAAGAIINRGSQDLDILKISHKGPNDFVSEVDQAAEAAIIEILLGAYPQHGILAEESGREHGAKHSEFVWIIDPLDGTTNFLHGFPVYAVSIALAFRGQVQQAVVYDPTRNDLFYASRGRGAHLNDRRLRVSKRTRLSDSLVGTGFPFRRGDSFQRYVKMFETVMQNCAGVRRPGAAALDLCYVAAGWYDGFFETGLNPWDMAAGSLMITEAGGLVGNFTGEADFLYQREVVAGNPKVYAQLVTLLAPHTRVIKADEATETAAATADGSDIVAAALAATQQVEGGGPAAETPASEAPARERKPVRIRKVEKPAEEAGADAAPPAYDAPRGPRPAQGPARGPAPARRGPPGQRSSGPGHAAPPARRGPPKPRG